MNTFTIGIIPFGKSALIIQWPSEVNALILKDILDFKGILEAHFSSDWEFVPAYTSLTLVNNLDPIDFKSTKDKIIELYGMAKNTAKSERYLWRFPVCYDDGFAVDMPYLETQLQLSKNEIVHLHTSHRYLVYGIGFLPGFMYLGGLPTVLETKRRDVPRLHVDRGSVGLAGQQTGIYPQDSPGGWNIIGKCPVPIFNASSKNPCFIGVGDWVEFFSISKAEYEIYTIEAQVGILQPEKMILHA